MKLSLKPFRKSLQGKTKRNLQERKTTDRKEIFDKEKPE